MWKSDNEGNSKTSWGVSFDSGIILTESIDSFESIFLWYSLIYTNIGIDKELLLDLILLN